MRLARRRARGANSGGEGDDGESEEGGGEEGAVSDPRHGDHELLVDTEKDFMMRRTTR